MKIVVTGATGLIGRHAVARLHAANCTARFQTVPLPYDVLALDRQGFHDDAVLAAAVKNADAILHFAGVHVGLDDQVEPANPFLAQRLLRACRAVGAEPHIIYANSIHADKDTAYGRSKRQAWDVLQTFSKPATNLILPHVFGEYARPFHNSVTATFIHQMLNDQPTQADTGATVRLVHAGVVADTAIAAVRECHKGDLMIPPARNMSVRTLLQQLQALHASYRANVFPDVSDPFDAQLFNSYRAAIPSCNWPRPLHTHTDQRGTLWEVIKGGGGGQTFASITALGATRGNHFHLRKIERFTVLEGKAIIRIRPVLAPSVWCHRVSGDMPTAIDMPTLHTHAIENVGHRPLLTLFWTHEQFDPTDTDTYADPVLQ